MDADGTIRDLSAHVDDINSAAISVDGLAKLADINPASLPAVDGDPRLGPASVTSANSCVSV